MPTRVRQERAAIAELQENSAWLTGVRWRPEGDRLTAQFNIVIGDREVPLKIVYPTLYPDTAPSVVPIEDIRISDHQYGAGGELCLEFRPDNWEPTITGAMMIQSAHRLLSGESGANPQQQVPDVHETTSAQDMRGRILRFVLSVEALIALIGVKVGTTETIELIEYRYAGHWLAHLIAVGEGWKRDSPVRKYTKYAGHILRVPDGTTPPISDSINEIISFLDEIEGVHIREKIAPEDKDSFIILMSDVHIVLYLLDRAKNNVFIYKNVPFPDKAQRLPENHALLAEKSVAIIGCGSVGSKIAISLARSGIARFYLFDGDLLQLGNLVRNELDMRAVGLHKADGLKERIFEVAPRAKVEIQRALIGGQESAGTIDLALSRISKADIVIDATASPTVFNLCGSAARREEKPFVWVEVFGGGIGGLVARCRPHLDPVPHLARRQILAWCDQEGVPAPPSGQTNYEAASGSEAPMIADDADVAVLAAHATRMAIDALLRPSASMFPHSAYAVGLASGWLFTQPFDTRPIALVPDGHWGPEHEDNAIEQFVTLLEEIAPSEDNHEG